jgi:hypothetical protein
VTGVFDGIGLTRPLWPHQVRALGALNRDVARGDPATYLVVPPGGGKTLIGLEAARRLGRPAVVLCPNTAIQAQWMAQWQASFGPDPVPGRRRLDRLPRGHRHPGRPARRRRVRPHHPDPHPVAVTTRPSHYPAPVPGS